MRRLPARSQVFNNKQVDMLRLIIDDQISDLKKQYCDDLSNEEFRSRLFWHESVGMKILACRVLLLFNSYEFIERLSFVVKEYRSDNQLKLYAHPIFYLRISDPRLTNEHTSASAFFDSQPHYDRSFGIKAYSLWTAITDISNATGGLCFFKNNDFSNKTWPKDLKVNPYNYELYLERCHEIDNELMNSVIHPYLRRGECYLFDWHNLHAATKPHTKLRISLDFRLTESKLCMDINPFKAMNISITYTLLFMLASLGDRSFISEVDQKIDLGSFREYLFNLTNNKQVNLFTKLAWRDEYMWLDDNIFETFVANKRYLINNEKKLSKNVADLLCKVGRTTSI